MQLSLKHQALGWEGRFLFFSVALRLTPGGGGAGGESLNSPQPLPVLGAPLSI